MVPAVSSRTPRGARPFGCRLLAATALFTGACFVSAYARLCFAGAPSGAQRLGSVRRRAAAAGSAAATAELRPPRGGINGEVVMMQNQAGHKMRELGLKLEGMRFEAKALEDKVQATYDGMQGLRGVSVLPEALAAAGGDKSALAKAVLSALQEAHDDSVSATKDDVWSLHRENGALLQAPLVQIGAGSTVEDMWVNVTKNDETVGLAEKLFDRFDIDKDGFWNFDETSKVQMATEGAEMTEDAFTSLVVAAAPNGGRQLTEDDLRSGLSRAQVVDLYTDRERQRQLGFMLDIRKDYAKVFDTAAAAAPAADAADPGEGAPAAASAPAQDSAASLPVD